MGIRCGWSRGWPERPASREHGVVGDGLHPDVEVAGDLEGRALAKQARNLCALGAPDRPESASRQAGRAPRPRLVWRKPFSGVIFCLAYETSRAEPADRAGPLPGTTGMSVSQPLERLAPALADRYRLERGGGLVSLRGAIERPASYLRVVPDRVSRMTRAVDAANR